MRILSWECAGSMICIIIVSRCTSRVQDGPANQHLLVFFVCFSIPGFSDLGKWCRQDLLKERLCTAEKEGKDSNPSPRQTPCHKNTGTQYTTMGLLQISYGDLTETSWGGKAKLSRGLPHELGTHSRLEGTLLRRLAFGGA